MVLAPGLTHPRRVPCATCLAASAGSAATSASAPARRLSVAVLQCSSQPASMWALGAKCSGCCCWSVAGDAGVHVDATQADCKRPGMRGRHGDTGAERHGVYRLHARCTGGTRPCRRQCQALSPSVQGSRTHKMADHAPRTQRASASLLRSSLRPLLQALRIGHILKGSSAPCSRVVYILRCPTGQQQSGGSGTTTGC